MYTHTHKHKKGREGGGRKHKCLSNILDCRELFVVPDKLDSLCRQRRWVNYSEKKQAHVAKKSQKIQVTKNQKVTQKSKSHKKSKSRKRNKVRIKTSV